MYILMLEQITLLFLINIRIEVKRIKCKQMMNYHD